MDLETQQNLLNKLGDGDQIAFNRIYDCFRARLYGYLVRLSKRQDVAEDLLQETWIRLVTRTPILKKDTSLAAWLFTVARNLYLSYRRWRLLDMNRVQEMTRIHIDHDLDSCPFELVAESETERHIEQALSRLPFRYRDVVVLVYVEGLSHTEAAMVCDLKPEAFRKRLSRAREMLAKRLEKSAPKMLYALNKEKI